MKYQHRNRTIFYCFFIIAVLLNIGLKVNAAPAGEPLTRYPGIHLVSPDDFTSNTEISEEYATVMRPSSELTYTVSGNSGTSNNINAIDYLYSFNQAAIKGARPCYLQANNVAIYKGNIIDLRINIKPESTANYVYLYAPSYAPKKNMDNFLRIDVAKKGDYALIDYEFYIHGTNQKVDFSANWNYAWINDYKAITQPMNQIKDVYTYDIDPMTKPVPLYYDKNFIPDNNLSVYGKNTSQNFILENAYTILFDTTDGTLHQRIDSLKARSWTKYSAKAITKTELPSPQIIGETSIYPEIKFTANQDMNSQARPDFYPRFYRMHVRLKDASVLDWNNTDVAISDVTGTSDNTTNSFFDITKNAVGNELTIDVDGDTLRRDDFVDNSYFFKIKGKIKNTSSIDRYYKPDGYFHVPVYVQYETDTNASVENKSYAKIKATLTGKTKVQTVPQGTSTKDWSGYKVSDLFSEYKAPLSDEKVSISNIEPVIFSSLKDYIVKVTLKSEKTGIEQTFDVPVKVKAKSTAIINFVDEKGKKLSDVITKTGFEGESYDYSKEIKKIPGYNFLKVDDKEGTSPIKGIYPNAPGSSEIKITIVYKISQSKMNVKQVYKTKQNQAIYKDIENQKTVNNDATYDEIIGTSLPGIIDKMKKNDKQDITIDYNWYQPIDSKKDYIVLIDGKEVKTEVVPEDNFELLILYTGITHLEVSALDYGEITTTSKDNVLYNNPDKNQNIKVVNTDLDTKWKLRVSMSGKIQDETKTNDYLGGLLIKRDGKNQVISEEAIKFTDQEKQNNQLSSSIPMDVKLYQNVGNKLGEYKGNVLWTLQDGPN